MSVEAVIGLADQLAVKAFFARARFVASHQQDRFAGYIERESHSPHAVRRIEPELFHISVARSLERVDARPAELWPELLKKARQGQNFGSHVHVQRVELRLKLIPDLNNPSSLL